MRKHFKIKRRSCALCNPHKRGWANRWTDQEWQSIVRFDNVRRNFLQGAEFRAPTSTNDPAPFGNAFVFGVSDPATYC